VGYLWSDYWVVKLNSTGAIHAQNTIGGDQGDYLHDIQQTTDGGYILGGSSSSGISGDKTEAYLGRTDYWVVKINNLGEIEWQNTLGGVFYDQLISVSQTSDGGYILGGYSSSDISEDKTEDSRFEDYWIVKLDNAGNIEWQNTIEGNSLDNLTSVQQTIDGGYILGGYSTSGIQWDKTEANMGGSYSTDYWVIKLNSLGGIEWQNTIGGSSSDYLYSIEQTLDGGYILGGDSFSGISGDKTEASLGGTDYWIVKLNSTGAIVGQNTIGGSSYDYLRSIQQTADGGSILGGFSDSGISGDKTEASQGLTDYWVIKLNSLGGIEWQNTIGGSSSDNLYSIEQTLDGGYILGGNSNSGISGDKTEPNLGASYSGDYWVIKLYPDPIFCSLASTITPASPTTFCKPGSVTLNAPVDTGYTYQWKKNGVNISGATSATFNATKNGNYQVDIVNGTCSDISDSLLVTATPKPNATINNVDATNDICFDSSIELNATTGTGYTYQWRKDGVLIAGATTNIYSAMTAGDYSVKVTNTTGCTKTSAPYTIIETCKLGMLSDEITIYPNPNTGEFIIQLSRTDEENITFIQIKNMLGEDVYSVELNSDELSHSIKLDNFSDGMYFVEIHTSEGVVTKQVVVQR
jgi:hypothetical protein